MNSIHLGILLLLGLSLFGATVGGWLFQRLRIPQVVGYLAAGLLLGESGFRVINEQSILQLRPFTIFALGIIGFLVGAGLQIEDFRRYGKQFMAILLGEGVFAFVLVTLGTGIIFYHLTGQFATSLAAGIVLGAIASATDPASTISVLWEYRCRGVFTTTVTAIVALDDALAMTLYAVGTGTAAVLVGAHGGVAVKMLRVGGEIGAALLLGVVVALLLNLLLRWAKDGAQSLALSLSVLLLMIGLSQVLDLDVILSSMACGFVIGNMAPRRNRPMIQVLREFSAPVYVLFFLLVGARLAVHSFPLWLGMIVVVYVIGRTAGKMSGSWLGARLTHSTDAVRRYLGLGLFAQGGVAVGLSIIASQHLQHIPAAGGLTLGDAVIFTVTATTLIVQILGPPTVKLSAHLAGEIGKDKTEEDVLNAHKVRDWMNRHIPEAHETDPLSKAIDRFSSEEFGTLFVLDKDGNLAGRLTIDGLRQILPEPSTWQWVLVTDLIEPVHEFVYADEPLADAVQRMRQAGMEECIVLPAPGEMKPLGVLVMREVRTRLRRELLSAAETGEKNSGEPGGGSSPAPAPA